MDVLLSALPFLEVHAAWFNTWETICRNPFFEAETRSKEDKLGKKWGFSLQKNVMNKPISLRNVTLVRSSSALVFSSFSNSTWLNKYTMYKVHVAHNFDWQASESIIEHVLQDKHKLILISIQTFLYILIYTSFENCSKYRIWILAFCTNFCPIKTDLSGNTVWPQALDFQKFTKMDHCWHF